MTDKVEDEAPKEDVVDSKVLDSEEGGESGEQVAVLAPEEEKGTELWLDAEGRVG
jgi:hypothetical protein